MMELKDFCIIKTAETPGKYYAKYLPTDLLDDWSLVTWNDPMSGNLESEGSKRKVKRAAKRWLRRKRRERAWTPNRIVDSVR